jgi:hypothetical protein
MSFLNIIIIVIVLIILFFIIRYFWYKSSILVDNINDATLHTKIDASSLTPPPSGTVASNFTYSVWIYINDWSYEYGKEKIIFSRVDNNSTKLYPSPIVKLGAIENDLIISQEVYNTTTTSSSSSSTNSSTSTFTCGVSNIPLQKWVNILVSIYGRSMDIYLDGKLVRTCVMPGTASVSGSSPVNLTPHGGFAGYTSKFEYWPDSTNPQMAWNIYAKGYKNSWSLFSSKYSVEITVYNGDTVANSISI